MDDLPRLQLHQIDTMESCTHEVALPPDMQYTPLKPATGPPVKEYPFILDPFQKESILCLENSESVGNMDVLNYCYYSIINMVPFYFYFHTPSHAGLLQYCVAVKFLPTRRTS